MLICYFFAFLEYVFLPSRSNSNCQYRLLVTVVAIISFLYDDTLSFLILMSHICLVDERCCAYFRVDLCRAYLSSLLVTKCLSGAWLFISGFAHRAAAIFFVRSKFDCAALRHG